MEYQQLLRVLRENSDGNFDEFNRKIISSSVRTIGCTVPFVRKLAKQTTLKESLSYPYHEYYEVDLLKGLVVSSAKMSFADKRPYLTEFAEKIENWAVCDCSTLKVPKNERDEYFAYFCDMCASDKTFVARYGIVNLLANYLDTEHVEKIFSSFCQVVTFGDYYVDMAVAWLVATAMTKCREQTVRYMEGGAKLTLNKFAYNKALQKMRDSFRVSPEDKAWTKTLRIL
ncbi:MAG: DNA alkylation repair protein [Corallococcus sp.]|nr:DNA alkylation repair protein [Corallococcus sp.]MCM1359271.1 DNA alkylation repair protein [Corallococcus sp.]MCM1394662.1 DNA alkylation repair protein [Corallococcus sp.]